MEMQEWQQDFFKPEHTKIYHIERILSADNLPIIYEHIYIPTDFLPDFQVEKLENGSLTRLLNKEYHMKESEKARSTVEVSTVSQPVAGYLRMNEGEPVMILASYINNEKEDGYIGFYDTKTIYRLKGDKNE